MITRIHRHVKKCHKHYLCGLGVVGLFLLALTLVVHQPGQSHADTAGGNFAGAGASVARAGGDVHRSNPGNITAEDTNYATANIGRSDTSHYLHATNFGFAIPSDATIDGIEVKIMRKSSSDTMGRSINDDRLQLLKAGSRVGTNNASSVDRPTSMTEATYGGSSNLRGTTWTPAEVNANDFGVTLAVLNESNMTSRTASVDYIKITVTYTPAAPVDNIPPTVTEVTSIGSTYDTTPDYTFHTDEAGTVFYGGDCNGTVGGSVATGNNTVTFAALPAGPHDNCTVNVVDSAGNTGTLNVTLFEILTQKKTFYHSKYDYNQRTTTQETSTEEHEAAGEEETTEGGSIEGSTYSEEVNNAYLYAYDIGFLTDTTIQDVNMNDTLLRATMAKLMSDYAMDVLGKTPDTSKVCVFTDITDETAESQAHIVRSCQLDLMGIDMNDMFNPRGIVTKAESVTTLSRVLYGSIHNAGTPRYLNHFNALIDAGIVIDNIMYPENTYETIEGMILMIYRASK